MSAVPGPGWRDRFPVIQSQWVQSYKAPSNDGTWFSFACLINFRFSILDLCWGFYAILQDLKNGDTLDVSVFLAFSVCCAWCQLLLYLIVTWSLLLYHHLWTFSLHCTTHQCLMSSKVSQGTMYWNVLKCIKIIQSMYIYIYEYIYIYTYNYIIYIYLYLSYRYWLYAYEPLASNNQIKAQF